MIYYLISKKDMNCETTDWVTKQPSNLKTTQQKSLLTVQSCTVTHTTYAHCVHSHFSGEPGLDSK